MQKIARVDFLFNDAEDNDNGVLNIRTSSPAVQESSRLEESTVEELIRLEPSKRRK